MAKWARIQTIEQYTANDDGTFTPVTVDAVVEVIDTSPEGVFHPDIKWLDVAPEFEDFIDQNYVFVKGSGKKTKDRVEPRDVPYYVSQLKGAVAAKRWDVQVSGVPALNAIFQTDAESIAKIDSAITDATIWAENPDNKDKPFTRQWKASNGFVELTAVQLKQVKITISDFVNAAFGREAVIDKLLDEEVATGSDFATLFAAFKANVNTGWAVVDTAEEDNVADTKNVAEPVAEFVLPSVEEIAAKLKIEGGDNLPETPPSEGIVMSDPEPTVITYAPLDTTAPKVEVGQPVEEPAPAA